MKRFFAVLNVCAVLWLCALSAYSQTLTGNITARAQDTTGAVIPGVEVTISSPSMIGIERSMPAMVSATACGGCVCTTALTSARSR